jgi:hypothetical protein
MKKVQPSCKILLIKKAFEYRFVFANNKQTDDLLKDGWKEVDNKIVLFKVIEVPGD